MPRRSSTPRSTCATPIAKSSHAARAIDVVAIGAIQQSATDRVASARRLPLRLREQPRQRRSTTLVVWTSSDSAAFARASTTAPAAEGRAGGIARASVVGVELHMHPDVGVCSIGYDELIAVLLLRQQRGYAAQPAPGLWNGRHARAPRPSRRAAERPRRCGSRAVQDILCCGPGAPGPGIRSGGRCGIWRRR